MSPRAYSVETEMPALVRTHSSSSTNSSAPSTPVTESGCPFEFDECAAKAIHDQVEVPISSQTASSQTRRFVAYQPIMMAQPEVVKTNDNSIQSVQKLFLLAMLLVDAFRVLSWVPICLWIIMGEVWVVAEHELQIEVKKAAGSTVAVVGMMIGFLLFITVLGSQRLKARDGMELTTLGWSTGRELASAAFKSENMSRGQLV
ncbi:hypothetical protein EXIGLDRAFT_796417 [Exidia glandulosa HHB12029]|uniref:Uncharacterized protein n=1 Tax=Exidia glandulosa HHB12029 TaxID=1314781 RepID=A0A165FPI3_EXIGL|nr:hypothetical protein EXIGLDRAFT_796417 [Exidia glandulosa HHB12029]